MKIFTSGIAIYENFKSEEWSVSTAATAHTARLAEEAAGLLQSCYNAGNPNPRQRKTPSLIMLTMLTLPVKWGLENKQMLGIFENSEVGLQF